MLKNIMDALYLPYLSQICYIPDKQGCKSMGTGVYFKIDPSLGDGFCWVYPVDHLFAITINQIVFHCDVSLKYEQPEFLNVGSYGQSAARIMRHQMIGRKQDSNMPDTVSNILAAHASDESQFNMQCLCNDQITSVSINLLPAFYKQFLPARYGREAGLLPRIFSMLNGDFAIPEITTALDQIRAYQPSGPNARMYYEGKVLEIISYLLQWGENQLEDSRSSVADVDLEQLETVRNYLQAHYNKQESLPVLAGIACMSTSKLTTSFKRVYGMTMTEYLQAVRVERAKDMLFHSKQGIKEVAQAVGYKKHASFSEIFKRITGITPKEYREKQ